MENYIYCVDETSGKILFRYNNSEQYFYNPRFKNAWCEIGEREEEAGIHPRFSYKRLTEDEAKKLATSLGMSGEDFYN